MRRLGRKQGGGWPRNLVRGQLCSGLETLLLFWLSLGCHFSSHLLPRAGFSRSAPLGGSITKHSCPYHSPARKLGEGWGPLWTALGPSLWQEHSLFL